MSHLVDMVEQSRAKLIHGRELYGTLRLGVTAVGIVIAFLL